MSSRPMWLALVLAGCGAGATDPISPPGAGIRVSPIAAVVQASQTQTFKAYLVDSTGRHLGPATVRWTSSLPAIATMTQSGVATGSLPGQTTIRAIAENGAVDSAALVVIPNLEVGNHVRGRS